MKHLFIVNPVAGGSDRTDHVAAEVAKCFSGRSDTFEIYRTAGPMDARDAVKRAGETGETVRVYACGGDGTLNECVCGALGFPNVAVTCCPTGTGTDFIRLFGEERQRFYSLRELTEGEVRRLDVMTVNDRPCLNICSLGIDARIGTDVHKYSALPLVGGAAGYVVSAAVNFFKGIADEMQIMCGGRLYYGPMTLLCICNGAYYGGGFHPVPEARPDDGLLDILIVPKVSRVNFARLIGKYAAGRYAELPQHITHLRAREIEIECEKELVVNIDGEAMHASSITVRLQSAALPFVVPKGLAYFENGEIN